MEKKTEEYIKRNLLALAEDHKKHCKSSNCKINLLAVRLTFEILNISLTEEESAILF